MFNDESKVFVRLYELVYILTIFFDHSNEVVTILTIFENI